MLQCTGDCGLLHHAFRGRRGLPSLSSLYSTVTTASAKKQRLTISRATQWMSGLLYSACWLCRVESCFLAGNPPRRGQYEVGWLLSCWSHPPLLSPAVDFIGLMRPRKGEERGDCESTELGYRRSILGRLSQLPSMWSWEEELSAFSHNHANLPSVR